MSEAPADILTRLRRGIEWQIYWFLLCIVALSLSALYFVASLFVFGWVHQVASLQLTGAVRSVVQGVEAFASLAGYGVFVFPKLRHLVREGANG